MLNIRIWPGRMRTGGDKDHLGRKKIMSTTRVEIERCMTDIESVILTCPALCHTTCVLFCIRRGRCRTSRRIIHPLPFSLPSLRNDARYIAEPSLIVNEWLASSFVLLLVLFLLLVPLLHLFLLFLSLPHFLYPIVFPNTFWIGYPSHTVPPLSYSCLDLHHIPVSLVSIPVVGTDIIPSHPHSLSLGPFSTAEIYPAS